MLVATSDDAVHFLEPKGTMERLVLRGIATPVPGMSLAGFALSPDRRTVATSELGNERVSICGG